MQTSYFRVSFDAGRRPKIEIKTEAASVSDAQRLPRTTMLMALAVQLEQPVHNAPDAVLDEVARLVCASPVRVTPIINLLFLAPDILEPILFLEKSARLWPGVKASGFKQMATTVTLESAAADVKSIASDSTISKTHKR